MKSPISSTTASSTPNIPDVYTDAKTYENFLVTLQLNLMVPDGTPIFTTDAVGVYEAYLKSFPDWDVRQYHTCRCCQNFIERYGHLVYVDNGVTVPLLWRNLNLLAPYTVNAQKMAQIVKKSQITGVFYTDSAQWGQKVTGKWMHLSGVGPKSAVYSLRGRTPEQAMAAKLEDHKNVSYALVTYDYKSLEQAVVMLETDMLYRGMKVAEPARWLLNMYRKTPNEFWVAIAKAPDGFCHPRSSMISTLLDDIQARLPIKDVMDKFRAKMNPTKYQRPTAPPKDQAITQAEKLVATLGIAKSLERRFANLNDITALWMPKTPPEKGIFSALRNEPPRPLPNATTVPMSAYKFMRTVLPTVTSMRCIMSGQSQFIQFATAVHKDAPPIMQWDLPEDRNPVSWYFRTVTDTRKFNAYSHSIDVTAVTLLPHQWKGDKYNHAKGLVFLLSQVQDGYANLSGILPEFLKGELHGMKSVIEAHSNRTPMAFNSASSTAAGLAVLDTGNNQPILLQVTLQGGIHMQVLIDRYE